MKTIDDYRTDYLNEVFALVNSNKITVDEADKLMTAVSKYTEALGKLIIDGI